MIKPEFGRNGVFRSVQPVLAAWSPSQRNSWAIAVTHLTDLARAVCRAYDEGHAPGGSRASKDGDGKLIIGARCADRLSKRHRMLVAGCSDPEIEPFDTGLGHRVHPAFCESVVSN